MVTDQPEKQIAAEIIREKLLWLLDKEVPHGIAIEITKMQEKEKITNIYATIYCEKASISPVLVKVSHESLLSSITYPSEKITYYPYVFHFFSGYTNTIYYSFVKPKFLIKKSLFLQSDFTFTKSSR